MKPFQAIYEYLNLKRINPDKTKELKPLITHFIDTNSFQTKIKTMDAIVNFSNEIFECGELIIKQIPILYLESSK